MYELFEVVNNKNDNQVVALFFDYHLAEKFVDANKDVYFFDLRIDKMLLTGKELAILTDLLIKD